MSSVLSSEPWLRDPEVVSIPWRQGIADTVLRRERPLKLGIFWNDGEVEPHPPIKRGLRMVVEAVRKAGHKVSMEEIVEHLILQGHRKLR